LKAWCLAAEILDFGYGSRTCNLVTDWDTYVAPKEDGSKRHVSLGNGRPGSNINRIDIDPNITIQTYWSNDPVVMRSSCDGCLLKWTGGFQLPGYDKRETESHCYTPASFKCASWCKQHKSAWSKKCMFDSYCVDCVECYDIFGSEARRYEEWHKHGYQYNYLKNYAAVNPLYRDDADMPKWNYR
jgi:hypothetical protein